MPPPQPAPPEGSRSYVVTLLLSLFLGFFGADRFYLGKTRSAFFKLFTFGGFGYWWFADILIVLFGGQRDAWGFRLEGYGRYKKKVWIVLAAVYGSMLALGLVSIGLTAFFSGTDQARFNWLLVLLGASGAAAAAWWFFRRRKRPKQPRRQRAAEPVPPTISAQIARIGELRMLYMMHAATGDEAAIAVVGLIDSLTGNARELFIRLSAKADKAERSRAEAEYLDKLGKLAAALDREYLLDVLANPRLWDEPDQRVRAVLQAAQLIDDQLLNNVRQVNARRALVFQVRIDALLGPGKEMDDWQREFNRAAGDE